MRNYFKIIRIRYENRFSLEVNVGDDIMDLQVPQLILQPVVENAVKHGLKGKKGEGVVAIQASVEQDAPGDHGHGQRDRHDAGAAGVRAAGPGEP